MCEGSLVLGRQEVAGQRLAGPAVCGCSKLALQGRRQALLFSALQIALQSLFRSLVRCPRETALVLGRQEVAGDSLAGAAICRGGELALHRRREELVL